MTRSFNRRRWPAPAAAALLALACSVAQAQETTRGLCFSEGFEDPDLLGRGWYDGRTFALADDHAGPGKRSIRYHFTTGKLTPVDSSGVRHSIEPTAVVFLRFSLNSTDAVLGGAASAVA